VSFCSAIFDQTSTHRTHCFAKRLNFGVLNKINKQRRPFCPFVRNAIVFAILRWIKKHFIAARTFKIDDCGVAKLARCQIRPDLGAVYTMRWNVTHMRINSY